MEDGASGFWVTIGPVSCTTMTLPRMIFVLSAALAVMLTVVILRAEVTGLHYRISQLDQKAEVIVQQMREEQLELQRLRNPALIRERARELRPKISAPTTRPVRPKRIERQG